MTRIDHDLVTELFVAACDLPAAEQAVFLREACDDEAVRSEVQKLLAHDAEGPTHGDVFSDASIDEAKHLRSLKPAPEQIGGYEIIREIGRGGMGVVYEALQRSPERRVAVKVAHYGSTSPSGLLRFRREMEALGRLRHPSIATIFDSGSDGGRPYFAMELIDGEPITAYVRRAKLGQQAVLELIARVADAVHHAHQKGVIHRDLKPDNVLVTESPSSGGTGSGPRSGDGPAASVHGFPGLGLPKVLDFGVARLVLDEHAVPTLATTPGQIVGTLGYMSPEQVSGSRDVDVRADVYALGVLAYELIAGRRPFDLASTPLAAAVRKLEEEDPPPLSKVAPIARGDVSTIIKKAMSREASDRYGSAGELSADIRRFLSHEPIAARSASVLYEARRFARRHRGLFVGAMLALVALIGGTVATAVFAVHAEASKRRAEAFAYRASLEAASAALTDLDAERASRFLDGCPEALRGWEWHHLAARADNGSLGETIAPPGSTLDVVGVRDSGGSVLVRVTDDSGQRVLELPTDPLGDIGTASEYGGDGRGTWRGGVLPFLRPNSISTEAGPLALTHGRGNGPAFLWLHPSTANATLGFRLPVLIRRWSVDQNIRSSALHPDELTGALGTAGGTVFLVDHASGEIIDGSPLILGVPVVSSLGFVDGGRRLIAISPGRMDCINVETGAREFRVSRPDFRFTGIVDLPGTGRFLTLNDESVEMWDARRIDRGVLRGHERWVNPIDVSADGSVIVSGAWDGTIRVWDAMSDRGKAVIRLPNSDRRYTAAIDVAIGPSGENATVAVNSGYNTPAEIYRVSLREPYETQLIGTTVGQTVSVWYEGETAAVLSGGPIEPGPFASQARLLPGLGQELVLPNQSAATKRTLLARPNASPEASSLAAMRLPDGVRYSVYAVSPEHRLLAVGHADVTRVYDARDRKMIAEMPGHTADILCAAFSPDGSRLATGSRDRTIIVWDTKSWQRLVVLRGHQDYVFDLQWTPDGQTLYSSSGDGTLRAWRTSYRR